MKKYPEHFYEPLRIEIAVQQIQHDLRKLLPSLDENDWQKVDDDIEGWFEGETFELEPAHDFWNFFGGFARGLKLKSLLYWITAENVHWERVTVPLNKIVITWDFPGLGLIGKAPLAAKHVIAEINKPESAAIKEAILNDARFRSRRYPPRDQFKIILFNDKDGQVFDSLPGYYILEGNRRVVRAIVTGQSSIPAYVGSFNSTQDQWPENYWLRTGLLRDLIFLAIYYDKTNDFTGFKTTRSFYQLLIRDFDLARIATFDKAFKSFECNSRLLRELLLEDLK